jgi:Ca2+-binding EF-hand superfamily protein
MNATKIIVSTAAVSFTACAAPHESSECARIHKQANVVFSHYDRDRDGRLSGQEYQPIVNAEREFDTKQIELRRALSDPSAHDAEFAHKDENRDGYLNLEEFIGGICKKGYVDRAPPPMPKD